MTLGQICCLASSISNKHEHFARVYSVISTFRKEPDVTVLKIIFSLVSIDQYIDLLTYDMNPTSVHQRALHTVMLHLVSMAIYALLSSSAPM